MAFRAPLRSAHGLSALTLGLAVAACQVSPATPPVPGTATPPAAAPVAVAPVAVAPAATSPAAPPASVPPTAAPIVTPPTGPTAPAVAPNTIAGVASSFGAPLGGASVVAYRAGAVGKGSPLATTTADAQGAFALKLPAGYGGVPVVVVATLGEKTLAGPAVLPAVEAAEAPARSVLQTGAGAEATEGTTMVLDEGLLVVYLALRDRLAGLTAMKPSATQVEDAFKAIEAARPAATEAAKGLRARAREDLLGALDATGGGDLPSALEREVAPADSDLAEALTEAADALGALIKARLEAGAKLPPGYRSEDFGFGGSDADPVVRRSNGNGSRHEEEDEVEEEEEEEEEAGTFFTVEASHMAVDRASGAVWTLNGTTLTLRSSSNEELGTIDTGDMGTVRAFEAVGVDRNDADDLDTGVWLVTSNGMKHYDYAGGTELGLVANRPYAGMTVDNLEASYFKDFSADPVDGDAWLLQTYEGSTNLYYLPADATAANVVTGTYIGDATHLAAVPGGDATWVTKRLFAIPNYVRQIARYKTDGTLEGHGNFYTSESADGVPAARNLAADPADATRAWFTDSINLARFSLNAPTIVRDGGSDENNALAQGSLVVDGTAWLFSGLKLIHVLAATPGSAVATDPADFGTPLDLAVDATDGSAWAVDSVGVLGHFTADATHTPIALPTFTAPTDATAKEVEVGNGVVWVRYESNPE